MASKNVSVKKEWDDDDKKEADSNKEKGEKNLKKN